MKGKIKKYFEEFKCGTKTMFKEFFNKKTNKKQRANMWTFSRLIITAFITLFTILFLALNSLTLIHIAGTCALIGAITDYFDGKSARKWESTSDYGKKLDQFVDKVFGCGTAINLALINPVYLTVMAGELSIASINLYFKSKYKKCNDSSSMLGKVKQWPLFASLFLGFFSTASSTLSIITKILLIITLLMQTATSIDYTKKNINKILEKKEIKKDNKIIIEEEKEYQKEKVYTKTNSKKEELIKLRNILLEVKNKKVLEENTEVKGKQKVIHY